MSVRHNEIWPAHRGKETDARLRMVGTVANGEVIVDGVHVEHKAARKVVESLPRNASAETIIRALKAVAPTNAGTRRFNPPAYGQT